jgi:putative resolvase
MLRCVAHKALSFCEWHGTRIVVINGGHLSPEKEMVEDSLAIVTVFSARFHGLQSYRKVIKDACEQKDQA